MTRSEQSIACADKGALDAWRGSDQRCDVTKGRACSPPGRERPPAAASALPRHSRPRGHERITRVIDLDHRRIILAVPRGAGVSPALKQLADEVITIDDVTLRSLVRINEE